MAKKRIPAVEGWFTLAAERPALLGTRCKACVTVLFPREETFCRSPLCQGTEFEELELSRRGRLWSYTNNGYQPPAPYVPVTDPYQPFAVAAVELEHERMVVLGQVLAGVGVADLEVGMEMELVLDTLSEDAENEYVVYKWKPVAA